MDKDRRNWLIATSAVGGVGAAAALYPFVDSFEPSERAKAAGAAVEIDIDGMKPDEMRTAEWRGKPVWVVRRTQEQVAELAKIDGGADIDTIRLGGTGGLNLDFSLISNTSAGNIEGSSRINSIERIDLRTDTSANQVTLRVADVLDMAGSNWANLNSLDSQGAGGWQNWTGSLFSASGVKYHQVAIDGTSADRVNISGWALQTGTVKDANSVIYDVYIATNGSPAMMLVQQDIVRFSTP
jgi:hypothetical protein